MRVPRGFGRRSYLLLVLPLPGSADTLVLADDPERERVVPADLLQALFGLTWAEAALAVELLQGRRLDQVASGRGGRLPTVRTQFRALLAKTGCGRQADLGRLLRFLTLTRLS